jgi:hypothetical protein
VERLTCRQIDPPAGRSVGCDEKKDEVHKKKRTYPLSRLPDVRTRCVLSWVAERQVTQLIALVEHLVTHGEVDDGGQHDAYPYRYVVSEDAQRVPAVTDPAPQLLAPLSDACSVLHNGVSCLFFRKRDLLSRCRILVREDRRGSRARPRPGVQGHRSRSRSISKHTAETRSGWRQERKPYTH